MVNIYWINIKLSAAANPYNLSSDFPFGNGKSISEYINFTTYYVEFLREGSDQSRYMPVFCF